MPLALSLTGMALAITGAMLMYFFTSKTNAQAFLYDNTLNAKVHFRWSRAGFIATIAGTSLQALAMVIATA